MKNFFNAIGVADMEKVHSAMIAWILDDDNDPLMSSSKTTNASSHFYTFPIDIRSKLLCKIFGVQLNYYKSIKTYVEWNDIDIMIETEDTQGAKDVWVIENKLKSQEHISQVSADEKKRWKINSDTIWQTEKYEHIIVKDYCLNTSTQTHFTLLSLGGDKAKSPTGNWSSYTYRDLSCFLMRQNLNNYVLIREYGDSISRIINELGKFLNTKAPSNYTHVFNKLKKSQKASAQLSQDERFIVENGLETIFQKQFLAKIIADKLPKLTNKVRYDERNGVAMFIVPVGWIGDYELNIEFQGGTFKVVLLHKDYIKRGSSNYTKPLYHKVYPVFQKLISNSGWSIACAKNLQNPQNPQNGTAKPRIALDKNIAPKGKHWYDDLSQFNSVYVEAQILANNILTSVHQI